MGPTPPPPPDTRHGTYPPLLTFGGHHWWLFKLVHLRTYPALVLTSSGGHQNTYSWQPGGTHPTGMHSCWHLSQTQRIVGLTILSEERHILRIYDSKLQNVTMSNMHRKCCSYTCMTTGEIKASCARETLSLGSNHCTGTRGFLWAVAIDYVIYYNVLDRQKYLQFVMNK